MKTLKLLGVCFALLFPIQGCSLFRDKEPPQQPPVSECSTYLGADWFAATNPNFACDKSLRLTDGSLCPAYGYLWGTFGEDHSS